MRRWPGWRNRSELSRVRSKSYTKELVRQAPLSARPRDTKIVSRRGADEGRPRAKAWCHLAEVEYFVSCGVTDGDGASYGVVYIMPIFSFAFSRWKFCNVSVWVTFCYLCFFLWQRLEFWNRSYAKWWCAKVMKKIFSKVVTHSTDDTGELELVQLFIHLIKKLSTYKIPFYTIKSFSVISQHFIIR